MTLIQQWKCERLKDVADINPDSLPANTDPDYEFDYLEISNVNYYGVVDANAIDHLRFEDAPSRARRRTCDNDTVISSVRPNLQAVAHIKGTNGGLVCSTGFNVVRVQTSTLQPRFAYYSLISEGGRQYFEATAKGVGYPAVDDKDFNSFPILLPTLCEQERIAAYLDASCAAIDAAVDVKRRQLQTLSALQSSTIQEAVLTGINPTVEMKPSSVEWFERVPTHWKVERLKDVVLAKKDAIKVGPFGSDLVLGDMTEEGIKVFNQRTVIDQNFDTGIHFISYEKYETLKAFTVFSGDLLITTRGTIGRCVTVPETAPIGILHPCLMRVQTNDSHLLTEYLAVLIQDAGLVLRQLQMMSAATTIDVVYSDSLKRTYLPLPPVAEQHEILQYIKCKKAQLESIKKQILTQIETLLAYRKSLIHECVTGQRRITDDDLDRVKTHVTA